MTAWRVLVHGSPGRRFLRYHERVQERASGLSMAVGIGVIALGLLLTLTPGPGAVVVLLGATMLAGRSRSAARALDRSEIRLRRAARVLHGATARLWRDKSRP